jgi:predicted  nucleic acid-binding Zn-ribbon protein
MDEKDYTDLAVRLQEVDSRCKSNEHRLDDHDEAIKEMRDDQKALIKLTNSVENMANSMLDVNKKVDVISDKQDKLNEKVTVLENRPAQETKKRWDSIAEKLIWLFVAGIAGFILAQVLPGIF